MSIKRITISVPEELADQIKEVAGERPVSAWITEVIREEVREAHADELWEEFVSEVNPGPEHYEWAEKVLASARAGDDKRAGGEHAA